MGTTAREWRGGLGGGVGKEGGNCVMCFGYRNKHKSGGQWKRSGSSVELTPYSGNLPLLFPIVLLAALAHIGLGNPLHGSHIRRGTSPFTQASHSTPDAQLCALVSLLGREKNLYLTF